MKRSTLLLIGIVIIKILMTYLVVNPIYELHRDEFLHLDQAKHLAWGFHSVPPFTSWVSWIILQLGNTVFWIKFFPSLFGALVIVLIWKAIEHLNGGLFACIIASIGLMLSVLLRINLLYQPNSFDILAWTAVYYGLLRFMQTNSNHYLYLIAISFATGFLNKYNIAFCLIGLLPALIISKQRKIFANVHFYGAITLALFLIGPNIFWQISHEFPVLKHMKELSETQLINVSRLDFLKEQLLFFIGSIFLIVLAFISLLVYKQFKEFQLFLWALFFTLITFVFFKAKAYYAVGLYPIFFAFGAAYLAKITTIGWSKYLRYPAFVLPVLFFIPLLLFYLPIRTPEEYFAAAKAGERMSAHKWEDGKQRPMSQDFANMLGWQELAHNVDSIYSTIPNKTTLMILCDSYGQAGAINYYSKIKGLKADAFNTDYEKWVNLNREITTVIRIKEFENRESNRDLKLFNTVKSVAEIKNPYARKNGTQIMVLAKPKLNLSKLLREERAKGNLH